MGPWGAAPRTTLALVLPALVAVEAGLLVPLYRLAGRPPVPVHAVPPVAADGAHRGAGRRVLAPPPGEALAPTLTERMHVFGSDEALALFSVLRPRGKGLEATRRGGRLQVRDRRPVALLYGAQVGGDLEATLTLVPQAGAPLVFGFLDSRGRGFGARIDAALPGRGELGRVTLWDGEPGAEVAAARPSRLAAGLPHVVCVRRRGASLAIDVDGETLVAAEVATWGEYRLLVSLPGGAAELRSVRIAAARWRDVLPAVEVAGIAHALGGAVSRFTAPAAHAPLAARGRRLSDVASTTLSKRTPRGPSEQG